MFAPAGAVWSLDAVLKRRRDPSPVMIPPWSVRLMQIQLAVIYLFTGISKLSGGLVGNDWITGEAVYWVLNDLSLTRWPYHWLPIPMFVCRLLSWGTLAFELGFAFVTVLPPRWVFVRRLRGGWLLAGVGAAPRHSDSHGSRLVQPGDAVLVCVVSVGGRGAV